MENCLPTQRDNFLNSILIRKSKFDFSFLFLTILAPILITIISVLMICFDRKTAYIEAKTIQIIYSISN